MTADFPAVIDANVLFRAALRDTLLRLASKRLFTARWSKEIIEETSRNLKSKAEMTDEQITHLHNQLEEHFGDAWVEGYEDLIPAMKNDEKDRHILAAAVKSGAEVIVTFNTKHFPASAVASLNIAVQRPDEFLIDLYYLSPELVTHVLHEQGAELKPPRTIEETLRVLVHVCPKFVQLIAERLSLTL